MRVRELGLAATLNRRVTTGKDKQKKACLINQDKLKFCNDKLGQGQNEAKEKMLRSWPKKYWLVPKSGD